MILIKLDLQGINDRIHFVHEERKSSYSSGFDMFPICGVNLYGASSISNRHGICAGKRFPVMRND